MGGIQHPWGLIRGVIDINGSHISEMCKTFLFDHTEHDDWSERNINITALFVERWISQLYCKYLDGSWENPEKVLPLFHLLFPPCDQSEFWVNCNSNKLAPSGIAHTLSKLTNNFQKRISSVKNSLESIVLGMITRHFLCQESDFQRIKYLAWQQNVLLFSPLSHKFRYMSMSP